MDNSIKTPVKSKLEATWRSFEVLKAAGVDALETAFTVGNCNYIVRMIDNRCILKVTNLTNGAEELFDFPDAYAGMRSILRGYK